MKNKKNWAVIIWGCFIIALIIGALQLSQTKLFAQLPLIVSTFIGFYGLFWLSHAINSTTNVAARVTSLITSIIGIGLTVYFSFVYYPLPAPKIVPIKQVPFIDDATSCLHRGGVKTHTTHPFGTPDTTLCNDGYTFEQ